jgi:hypothetical protein
MHILLYQQNTDSTFVDITDHLSYLFNCYRSQTQRCFIHAVKPPKFLVKSLSSNNIAGHLIPFTDYETVPVTVFQQEEQTHQAFGHDISNYNQNQGWNIGGISSKVRKIILGSLLSKLAELTFYIS